MRINQKVEGWCHVGTYECGRCLGKGRIYGFSHVHGGVCFKCGGTGRQTSKPTTPAPVFCVFLPNRTNGCVERIYNLKARTSAAALKAAERLYARASTAFRDEYTMRDAVAIRADELVDVYALDP